MADRICPSLRVAREKLCIAQTDVASGHKPMLQAALDTIDRLGAFYCEHWPVSEDHLLRPEAGS